MLVIVGTKRIHVHLGEFHEHSAGYGGNQAVYFSP